MRHHHHFYDDEAVEKVIAHTHDFKDPDHNCRDANGVVWWVHSDDDCRASEFEVEWRLPDFVPPERKPSEFATG